MRLCRINGRIGQCKKCLRGRPSQLLYEVALILCRVYLGLAIHAADLATYSSAPQLLPIQISEEHGFDDALFHAEDATTWRSLLARDDAGASSEVTLQSGSSARLRKPNFFLSMVILAQTVVNIYSLRDMARAGTHVGRSPVDTLSFYRHMTELSYRHEVFTGTIGRDPFQSKNLRIMWHYCCVLHLVEMNLIEENAGREGNPSPEVVQSMRCYLATPQARLATLHCAHILRDSANLTDLAFIVPRSVRPTPFLCPAEGVVCSAIFQSTLLLFSYLSYSQQPDISHPVIDTDEEYDWQELASCCSLPPTIDGTALLKTLTAIDEYIANGIGRIRIVGLIDGNDRHLDLVR